MKIGSAIATPPSNVPKLQSLAAQSLAVLIAKKNSIEAKLQNPDLNQQQKNDFKEELRRINEMIDQKIKKEFKTFS